MAGYPKIVERTRHFLHVRNSKQLNIEVRTRPDMKPRTNRIGWLKPTLDEQRFGGVLHRFVSFSRSFQNAMQGSKWELRPVLILE